MGHMQPAMAAIYDYYEPGGRGNQWAGPKWVGSWWVWP